MPALNITTNSLKLRDANEGFNEPIRKLGDEVAKAVGKPREYVAVNVIYNQFMDFAGDSKTPLALCTFTSIGNIDLEHNTAVSAAVAAFLDAELGVPPTRHYVAFTDYPRENMGYMGATFANLPKSS